MAADNHIIVDLFSGCGGFSLGAELAGFQTGVAVDIDGNLQSSFKLNFPNSTPILKDVASIEAADWKRLLGGTAPLGIIGGPPCQGFSRMGKNNPKDPRNRLIASFFQQCARLKPAFFVMENVPGLLDTDNRPILDVAMEALPARYKIVGPFKINASDFGAATDRERVIVVGYDPDRINPLTEESFIGNRSKRTNVKEAIANLPSPKSPAQNKDGFDWYKLLDRKLSETDIKRLKRNLPGVGLGWDTAKAMLKAGYITGLQETVHTKVVIKRFAKVPQGSTEDISRYPRLSLNGLCPTLRAGTGPDRGSFQSARPIHPTEARVISVREAARLQGFPDWFVFHPTKWHSFRMIGNSVSPLVARGLLGAIGSALGIKLAA